MTPERQKRYIYESGSQRFTFSLRRNNDVLQTVLSEILHEGTRPTSLSEAFFTKLRIHTEIAPLIPVFFTPSWMSPKGLLGMVRELSSSVVWKQLLDQSHPEIQRAIKEHLHVRSTDQVAKSIAIRNSSFMTAQIGLSALALATGPSIRECMFKYRGNEASAPVAIGDAYPQKPKSPDEYLDRLQRLVPNPNNANATEKGTMFYFLAQARAFDSPFDDSRCPAIPLTRMVLAQWGRQLDADYVYRERFLREITR